MVLFSWEQEPRLGQVKELNPDHRKPITVQLWKPHRAAQSLDTAKYVPSHHGDAPELVTLTIRQIRIVDLKLADSGYLTASSRAKVREMLRTWCAR